jgi:hypothetical protein
MKKVLLLIFSFSLLFQSCEKSPIHEPELLSFAFYQADNYSLLYDIELDTSGGEEIGHTVTFPVDLSVLKASFEVPEGCVVTVNGVQQESGVTVNDFTSPVEYTVINQKGDKKSYTIALSIGYEKFTGLPVLFINTENNKPILDKENWIAGDFSIMGSDGEYLLENNELEIRGRGNTTWQNPKKPYALKLSSKTELFGMPKHKRWVLLAAYNDKSMIRTDLAFYLAQKYSNMRWKQGGQLIELVLNGKYLGNYYLCEHIKIDDNRIPDGYVLEVDYRAKTANGDIFFKSEHSKLNFVIKDPDVEQSGEEFLYVENYINALEKELKEKNISNYSKYIHLESMVDWYLNSELTKNPDSGFFLSVYMNISDDGQLYMGPLWDYDLSFGNQVYDDGNGSDNGYAGFTIRDGDRSKIWLSAMFENPAFVELLKNKMAVIAANEAEIMSFIDKRHGELKKSALYNDRIWHLLTHAGASDEEIQKLYDEQIKYLKEWLHGRIEWLNTNIQGL